MKKLVMGLFLTMSLPASAFDKSEVVGAWHLDSAKSASAPDGNTAGVLANVEFKADGSFTALYGTQGSWKLEGKKLLVTYANSIRGAEEARLDDGFLKMPAPAMKGKFCYLKR
jgi:hypothetical protein